MAEYVLGLGWWHDGRFRRPVYRRERGGKDYATGYGADCTGSSNLDHQERDRALCCATDHGLEHAAKVYPKVLFRF